jgi:hypothetical protein
MAGSVVLPVGELGAHGEDSVDSAGRLSEAGKEAADAVSHQKDRSIDAFADPSKDGVEVEFAPVPPPDATSSQAGRT